MAIQQLQAWWSADLDAYHGICAPEFLAVAQLFSRLQATRGQQGGAALCIYFNKEKVVDIYSGWQSPQQTWQKNSMAMSYSTGKGVLATLAHILVSQGVLAYDEPIATYWPEFSQQQKQAITLRHVLSHQTGLHDIRSLIDDAHEMLDWSHMLQRIEQAKPHFAAGEHAAYQALSFGWILGGVLEKASQQSLQTLLYHYLKRPLQLEDSYFGVPDAALSRVARLILPTQAAAEMHRSAKPLTARLKQRYQQWQSNQASDVQAAMSPKGMRHFNWFDDQSLQAIMPAVNGVFSAENLARMYAMLANHGTWRGQRLIRPEILGLATKVQYRRRDWVMPKAMCWRLGYHRVFSFGKNTKHAYGHMGYNGSSAWCDPKRKLSFAYVHNFNSGALQADYRLLLLQQRALSCADTLLKRRAQAF